MPPENQCRLCIKTSGTLSPLVQSFTTLIKQLTSIEILSNEPSSRCCQDCLRDLEIVNKMRLRIIESDKVFQRERLIFSNSEDQPKEATPPDAPEDQIPVGETVILPQLKLETETSSEDEGDDQNDNDYETEDWTMQDSDSDASTDNKKQKVAKKVSAAPATTPPANSTSITITINPAINMEFRKRIELKKIASLKADPAPKTRRRAPSKPRNLYNCKGCPETFTTLPSLSRHQKIHDIMGECHICGARVLAHNLKKHMIVHNPKKAICELCGAVAKNIESLRGHIFYFHKSTAEQYICEHCGKNFRYKYKYKLHLKKEHGGEKTHTCEVCGKAFYTNYELRRHRKMTHLKERPYICPFCNKGFSSSFAKKTHVRQHTNEKPYKCTICGDGFRQRVSLKSHIKSQHGIIVKNHEHSIYCPEGSSTTTTLPMVPTTQF